MRILCRAAPAALALMVAGPAALSAETSDPPAEASAPPSMPEYEVDVAADERRRLTVPISIDGKGPYDFLIDTGAERTVISSELARHLALKEGKRAVMHSMSGVAEVSTVLIPTLQVSKKKVNGIHAPALKQANLGASGMLGIDALQSQRITFDFERDKMTVAPSNSPDTTSDGNEIVVTARSRLGRLVLVDASIEGEKLLVVLDTGAEVTIGNEALRRKLEAKRKIGQTYPIELISVTGGRLTADYTQARAIRLGGILIKEFPIGFAEVHPFKQLGLTDRPALLLGMDALRLFNRVSVDFARRKVRFLSPELRGVRFNLNTASAARPGSPLGD